MVLKPLFAYVDARLKQIKGSQKPFGGMSVIAFGDFYQLPPVRQPKPLCVYDPSQIDLWQEHFQMITLTEIMRRKMVLPLQRC
ncbi:ATP-dependent DNA helicase PIF1-like [Lates japonicus]